MKKYLDQIFKRANPLTPPSKIHFPKKFKSKSEVYEWIKQTIPKFKEWYQPIDFGSGVIAHQTTPPDWNPKPELFKDLGGGMAKWNFIIKKHLPPVKGKKILDLGCSAGLFSLEIAKMGAKEVIGIDRTNKINYHSTNVPPSQNVIAQANFVKFAFESLSGKKYPIRYIGANIAQLSKLNLGKFDLIIALCVVYHELDGTPDLINQLAKMTDHLILQGNEAHAGDLGRWGNKWKLAQLLYDAGFTKIEIDSPKGYPLPIIIGKK